VHEGETCGALVRSSDDQPSDLHDLAIAAGGHAPVPLRVRDVALRSSGVVLLPGHDGEQGMRDGVHEGKGALHG
jgi:hypothetical protein